MSAFTGMRLWENTGKVISDTGEWGEGMKELSIICAINERANC